MSEFIVPLLSILGASTIGALSAIRIVVIRITKTGRFELDGVRYRVVKDGE